MFQALAAISESVTQLMVAGAPLLSAIRIGPNRHITGLVCPGDTIVTIEQALPPLDLYTVVVSNRLLIPARPGARDGGANLALLHLETSWPAANPEIATAAVGTVVAVVGADADASPTVRLAVIHRFIRTADGPAPVLDLSAERVEQGSLVLDPNGRLIGLVSFGPNAEPMAIPSAVLGRLLMPHHRTVATLEVPALADPTPLRPSRRRGWLGVALQPITVPDQLISRVGQASGRMVVSITKGGPAEAAGMRVGDVLLALNGTSASGPQALRAFLGEDRVGTTVEVKLLRAGNVMTTHLTVADPPD